jgi:tyrosine-protein phosphatase 2/3
MLTAEMEGGTMKCHPYWKEPQYGPFELVFLNENRVSLEQNYSTQDNKRHSGPNLNASKSPTNESNVPHIIVRRFFLKHTSHPFAPGREITQLQYSHWPDFGVPAHPAHILGLVEHTDAVVRACSPSKAVFAQDALANVPHATKNTRPVLVHCSAGCGRTGAFCTVDSVIGMLRRQRFHKQYGYSRGSDELEIEGGPGGRPSTRESNNRPNSPTSQDNDWLDREDDDLIADVVHDFRKQRLSMVQSLRQYVLCYETVLEWIARQKPLDSAKRKAL